MYLTKTCVKIHGSFPRNSPVLVRLGCYNKTPRTGDLQTTDISHTLKGSRPSKSESGYLEVRRDSGEGEMTPFGAIDIFTILIVVMASS